MPSSGPLGAVRRRPLIFVFAAMFVASAALMVYYRSSLGFMLDDWAFVIGRHEGDAGDFFDPHNEHISILPVAIYKVFLGLFGMTSAMPLHVLSILVFFTSVIALFLYLRPLVGEPAAVIGCGVILFLGTAWEDLLWAFQIGFSISMAGGIGALIMLRRNDRFGDRVACLLLVLAMISTSMGIPFAVGAFVAIMLNGRGFARRLYVVAVPLAVYAAWWLGWGHTASSSISVDNALGAPEYIFDSFRLTISNLTGLFRLEDQMERIVSAGLAVAVIGAGVWAMVSRRRLPKAFLIAAAVALAFWGLAALNLAPGRGFDASRYQYPGAVLTLMMLAGAFEGMKIQPRFLAALAAVALFAIVANVFAMRDGYWGVFKPLSDKGTAGLTAVDLTSDSVDPGLAVGMNADDRAFVLAGAYLEAEDRYGPASWSEAELAEQSEAARARADQILTLALPVASAPARSMGAPCRTVEAAPGGGESVPLTTRTFTFRPQGDAYAGLLRFADTTLKGVAFGSPGKKTLVDVPPDESDRPWRIAFGGTGKVKVCAGGTGFEPGTGPQP